MTGRGSISVAPNRRFRLMLAAHALWLATLLALAAWWGRLLGKQAARIAELEAQIGVPAAAAHEHWERTRRMMFWESVTFFALLVSASVLLAWLTLRETKRARALQAFFASVTHELRTPLTSIRLQAESIAELSGEDRRTSAETSKRLVGRLLEDTSRLESQVERTLELARVEGGGPVLTRPLPLRGWLDYFLRAYEQDRPSSSLLDCDVGSCEIFADPGAMQVILKNLLENTARHAGRSRDARVTIRGESRGEWTVVRYSDDGGGFEGDERRLGRLFQKGEASSGAGVGLYLVSVLMKRMGGRAEFTGKPHFEAALWFRAAARTEGGDS